MRRSEWIGFGIAKQIIKPSIVKECVIGGYIESPVMDNVDMYDPKFEPMDDSWAWMEYGLSNGWITKTGCVLHELDQFNFIFTLQDIITLYPEKLPEIRKRTHIPENKDWFAYQSSAPEDLKILFKIAKEHSDSATIIDIGCGVGNVLKVGLESGYKNAIGVEVQEELCKLALQNVNADIVNESAETYMLEDKNMHVFLFNPFSNKILNIFLENNIDNIKKNKSLVIYNYAFSGHHLMIMYGLKPIYSDGFAVIYST